MRIVAALGGNALLKRGEPLDASVQRDNARCAARAIASLAVEHEVVVTHGNGPQVGLLALQAASYAAVAPYPLDVLGAESEGMIGYVLEQEFLNAMPGRNIAALLTQTRVSRDDPAFSRPTKFVGPQYKESDAKRLAAERHWAIARDGNAWRRVVPSPLPIELLEVAAVEALVAKKFLVICAGGGGVPVTRDENGWLSGVEAVVDKDRASALLADQLQADCLLMLTDVVAAFADWGTPGQRAIRRIAPEHVARIPFAAGSMGPKIESGVQFARLAGRRACIGALEDAADIVAGRAGTTIEAGVSSPQFEPCDVRT